MQGKLFAPAAAVLIAMSLIQAPSLAAVPAAAAHRDIAYAPADPAAGKGHLLDLFLPETRQGPIPVVIFMRGSAWMAENGREGADQVARQLNPLGYAVAGVNIRSSANARFPAQLHDVKAAVRWLRANASAYGLDAQKIAVMGESSGAWAAVMAGVTGDEPGLEGARDITGISSAVSAVVAFYPPTDFLAMDAFALGGCKDGVAVTPGAFCHDGADSPESRLIGCPLQTCAQKVETANPIRYISRADPPMLIFHGRKDRLVPFRQGQMLYEALSATCHVAGLIELPEADHGPFTKFLEDGQTRAGATMRTTNSGCDKSEPTAITPSWEVIARFLWNAFGG
jgi:acetyl esterase/lipase